MMVETVLVTGGAGYIGSHTVLELVNCGYEVVVIDNLCNSSEESLERVRDITGGSITFHKVDILDKNAIDDVFDRHNTISSVIHFAGLKAVGESVARPLDYYHTNITGTLNLLQSMKDHGVHDIVFSSSATVYGSCEQLPLTEDSPLSTTSPYGSTKLYIEGILRDVCVASPEWNVFLLRYFNPIGAHESGRIGEDPNGLPCNLMPFISQVAIGKREELSVFGGDYNTPDGTGVRDYIHVVDIALGHVAALRRFQDIPGCVTYNLGTGIGYSVLDMIKAFEKASGREVKHKIVARRPGDVATCYADPSLAKVGLKWEAKYSLDRMCEDLWRWQSQNPEGYPMK